MAKKRYQWLFEEEIVEAFAKDLKETGMSVPQMLEMIMRMQVSKTGKNIGRIFDAIYDMGVKKGKK
jgi:hypothetical protein